MSGNDGLYLGAALLGGAFLMSQSDDGITGGGLGETIREQIESVIAVPQVIKETTEKITSFSLPDLIPETDGENIDIQNPFAFDLGSLFPTQAEINTAAADAGSYAGQGIGGALGSAFLHGFTDMYKGAMVAGAQFVGRDDVNIDNVFSEFGKSANYLKSTSLNAIYTGVPKAASTIVKGALLGGDAGEAAKMLSISTSSSSSGGNGSAKLKDYKAKVQNSISTAVKTNGRTRFVKDPKTGKYRSSL